MIKSYFDRNVFADLSQERRGFSRDDVQRLRSAIRHGELSIAVSCTTLEETLAMWASNPIAALKEFQFVMGLAGQLKSFRRTRLVREAGDLLNTDIRAYAEGRGHHGNPWVFHNLESLLRDPMSARTRAAAEEFVREQHRQKQAFQDSMEARRRGVLAAVEAEKSLQLERTREVRRGFDAFFDQQAPDFAMALADRAGVLDSVKACGMKELLDLRSVRMEAGAILSLIYSHVFEGRVPQPGDSRDIHHAACASVADVFVTNDGSLAERLRRIPSLPVEVIDLMTLLGRIGRRPGHHNRQAGGDER